MKKMLAVILTVMLLVSTVPMGLFTVTASAATTGVTGECTWNLDGTVLTISGNGAMGDCDGAGLPWGNLITEVIIEDGVTSVGDSAFECCTNLESVTIPDSVTSIGKCAFSECSGLISVTIPESVKRIGDYAFDFCSKLKKVYITDVKAWCEIEFGNSTSNPLFYADRMYIDGEWLCDELVIPKGTRKIGKYALSLAGVTSVTVPDSVKVIEDGAFYKAWDLSFVNIPQSVTSIGDSAFFECKFLESITVPDSVTSIGDDAFNGCVRLHTVVLSKNLTNIGNNVFFECTDLNAVTIPDNVVNIGNSAFENCRSITSIIFPKNVKTIGDDAFYGCAKLESVTIGNKVTSIGNKAFKNCTSLASITISDNVKNIGDGAFENTAYFGNAANWKDGVLYIGNHLIKANTTVAGTYCLKEGTLTVADGAFNGCARLVSVDLGDSVISIGDNAFFGCTSLIMIALPDSVASIGANAFENTEYYNNDTNWENDILYIGNHLVKAKDTVSGELSLKDGTLSVAGNAFFECADLTAIVVPDSVVSFGKNAFFDCSNLLCVGITDLKKWCEIDFENSFSNPLYYADMLFLNGELLNGEVIIPDGTAKIGDYALSVDGITSVTIPDSVTYIGKDTFDNCTSLESIIVDDGNTTYHSAGNCIIETASKTLIAGCNASVIPSDSSVTSIGNGAFEYCSGLTEIAIPDGVTSIGEYAFYDCVNLNSITIPDTVTNIGHSAFFGCVSLTSVTYYSDANDWDVIDVEPNNDALSSVEFAYDLRPATPVAPTVAFEGNGKVELEIIDGCEYSMDGVEWQSGNVFRGLLPNTLYTFYCRVAETSETPASHMSDGLEVKTSDFLYSHKCDLNGDVTLNASDAIYLLYNTLYGDELYPVSSNHDLDINADNEINDKDAVYLLYAVVFGEEYYPLYPVGLGDAEMETPPDDKDDGYEPWIPVYPDADIGDADMENPSDDNDDGYEPWIPIL